MKVECYDCGQMVDEETTYQGRCVECTEIRHEEVENE